MAEFLSIEEIKAYYNKLLHKQWDFDTLKNSISEGKVKDILDYASEVHNEAWLRLNGFINPDTPYNWPYSLLPEIKIEDKLKDWLINSERVKQMIKTEFIGNNHLLNIPTKATKDEILDFWLRLRGNNEKGEPYWGNEKEIEHFVYQNFDVFPGVNEIKEFNPNMNKSELNHVTWTFYHYHGMSKTKKQYEKLLMQNFKKFKDGKDVYSNIKDQTNKHLSKLLE
jgi:hypothetical protein